ncbi:MAG: LacI family DNA-binding transcriptional regulator [Anaerolineae bacterium]
MAVTIRDVARHAGLSLATVSRALNDSGYVSPAARQRVEQAVAALGYQPNWLARGLRGKPSGLVGLIIPDIRNLYYTAVAHAVADALRACGSEMVLCVTNEDPATDLHFLTLLRDKRVDGIIYAHPAGGSNSAVVRALAASGLPIVELNRQREADLLDAVLADNERGAYQVTSYLAGLGHRRIGLIVGDPGLGNTGGRVAGYKRACAEAGLALDPDLVRSGAFSRAHGEAATRALLTLAEPPTALFAGSNRILVGVLEVLGREGIRIPADLSLAAFDDAEWLSIWNPPITAVDIAVDEMARLAVDLLQRRIAAAGAPHKPVTYVLSTRLIERESCRRVGTGNTERTESLGAH